MPFVMFVSTMLVMSWLAFMMEVDRLGIHHDLILIRCCSWLPELQ